MFDVVSSVAMPPRIVPNASGISSREVLTPAFLAAPEAAGSSTAAAAMLFMNSDKNAPAIITITIREQFASPAGTQQNVADLIGHARSLQGFGQHENRDDRDHRRPAEPGKRLLRRQHARHTESNRRPAVPQGPPAAGPSKKNQIAAPRITKVMISWLSIRQKYLV